ncbi:hypothetical protein FRC09_018962 [Ceratobasidium sp. 395]|nr:hypothetical protein FRC09_018962 [Ceratobasidium sp. 395]
MINSKMPPVEIIEHLTAHGCRNLTHNLDSSSLSTEPVSHSGFSNVYLERLLNGTWVAIKVLRVPLDHDDEAGKLPKATARELYAWSKCQHPNVLPLLGLVVFKGQIRMVSRWVGNGSLPFYLEKHPGTDRCDMSTQICDGVAYLHDIGVIHGDLKGSNVLVSEQDIPMITDFGNAVLEQGTLQFTETTKQSGFTPRWTAPEILNDEVTQSREADVYALGMTILWLESYRITTYDLVKRVSPLPHCYESSPIHLISKVPALIKVVVFDKKLPKRPEERIPSNTARGDALWLLLVSCWEYEPEKRPAARNVAEMVNNVARGNSVSLPAAAAVKFEGEDRAGFEAEPEPRPQSWGLWVNAALLNKLAGWFDYITRQEPLSSS